MKHLTKEAGISDGSCKIPQTKCETCRKMHTKNIFIPSFLANTYCILLLEESFLVWTWLNSGQHLLLTNTCLSIRTKHFDMKDKVWIKGFAWSRGYTLPAMAFMRETFGWDTCFSLMYLYLWPMCWTEWYKCKPCTGRTCKHLYMRVQVYE